MATFLEIAIAAAAVLSAGTAFIAAFSAERSKNAAESAQSAALAAWRDTADALAAANTRAAGSDRAAYGAALHAESSRILALRRQGAAAEAIASRSFPGDKLDEVLRAQFAANDLTASRFGRWVISYSNEVPLDPADTRALMDATMLVSNRIRGWILDSTGTMAEIRAIPGFVVSQLDPNDTHDFRYVD